MKFLTSKITDKKLFVFLILLTFSIRLIGLNLIPFEINQDEAMGAVDALSLSQYGTDRFGTFMPVHFTAWGYGQMSVLLSYLMVPFIKLFGFNLIAIRLPLALISSLSVIIIYKISEKYFSHKLSLLIMALVAINPWHIMQSRWALDCNLFPHIFLIGFYLLLCGLEKSRYLYLSMIFFALTFYCYGIALYTVPVFLFVFSLYCIWTKQLSLKTILLCALIFTTIALPEIIVMAINVLGIESIETPFFTMPYFPDSIRSTDILLLNFSFPQLWKNTLALLTQGFLQFPDHIFNTLPAFGPLYHISTPFIFIGIITFTKQLFTMIDLNLKTKYLALWGFLIMGIWAGVVTYEVNVNRINIIFYPLLFLCGYGIYQVYHFIQSNIKYQNYFLKICIASYGIYFIAFCFTYCTAFATEIKTYFNVSFIESIKHADQLEAYDSILITGNMDWQFNTSMAEILTQYSCGIDAAYFQGLTNIHQNQEVLPYTQRYQFLDFETYPYVENALYLIHTSELELFPYAYEIIIDHENYKGITVIP